MYPRSYKDPSNPWFLGQHLNVSIGAHDLARLLDIRKASQDALVYRATMVDDMRLEE